LSSFIFTSDQVVMYNIEEWERDKNNVCQDIDELPSHRLFAFVTSVMNFLNNFQTAQKAIKDASTAAEAAKTNIKDVQQSASRIELNVRFNAPIVYVSMSSKNEHSLTWAILWYRMISLFWIVNQFSSNWRI